MHTPSWASDRPTASRCSAVGFVTPPHARTAPRPGALRRPRMAVADRDELWEVQCQCIYCRDQPMPTISFSLAKPGEAMPGPYSSLIDGASPACVPERSRTVGPGEEIGVSADGALIRLLTSNKDSGTRRGAVHATVRSGSASLVVFTPGSCPPGSTTSAQPFQGDEYYQLKKEKDDCFSSGSCARPLP